MVWKIWCYYNIHIYLKYMEKIVEKKIVEKKIFMILIQVDD